MLASSTASNNSSYSNDRGPNLEPEYAVDPASGSFFHSDFRKYRRTPQFNKQSNELTARCFSGMTTWKKCWTPTKTAWNWRRWNV